MDATRAMSTLTICRAHGRVRAFVSRKSWTKELQDHHWNSMAVMSDKSIMLKTPGPGKPRGNSMYFWSPASIPQWAPCDGRNAALETVSGAKRSFAATASQRQGRPVAQGRRRRNPPCQYYEACGCEPWASRPPARTRRLRLGRGDAGCAERLHARRASLPRAVSFKYTLFLMHPPIARGRCER